MASLPLTSLSDTSGFDWNSEDNCVKWKGQFVRSLERVLYQTHPQFQADEESLSYVESLLVRLMLMITAKPAPSTVSDVEKRVSQTFPSPIDRWALEKAQKALKRVWKKSPMFLPVDKIHSLLKEVLHNTRLDDQVSLFIAAILQFIASDILNLACNYVLKISHNNISCQDIKTAMCADTVLMDMFEQDEIVIYHHPIEEQSTNQTYGDVVKDFIMDEKQYLRDLQMITKVFRDLIQKHNIAEANEIEAIFSNINEIVELTVTLIGSLEDTLEMTEDGNFPAVGSCFEELAEGEEFDVYDKYSQAVLSSDCRLALEGLLCRKDVTEKLISSGKGFVEAVKFYLPKLLLEPIFHCANYFKYLETLLTLQTGNEDDADALQQAVAMLTRLQSKIQMAIQQAGPFAKRKTGYLYPRCGPNKISRQQSLQKLSHIQQSIVNWEGKDIASNSSEVVCEGKLNVLIENRRRFAERYVYLFDGMILICKTNRKTGSALVGGGGGGCDLKLVSKHLIRRVDVLDRKDTEEVKHTFELIPRDQPRIILKADSGEEKTNWMSSLVMLNTKSMLERRLDINLSKEETKHPLRFPPSDQYKFSEPDNNSNIIFDEEKSNGIPLIKGATLEKLVERLTFHMHADPMFVKSFLTTYRSFSNPNTLLDLLIERFNIPDPQFSTDSASDSELADAKTDLQVWQDLKRFRKEYKQPVQFRVLNVLKHWVDEHFYDFEQDSELLGKLISFLDSITGKNMKKWVDCIIKIVQRRKSNEDANRDITFDFDRSPPEFEVHIDKPEPGWPELLTYHPIEIARQLTLLEFDYFRAVKPSELVDQSWMKEDKDKRSPNLLRMVRHTTMFTLYLEKLIVEAENLDERICVIHRALEIMLVLVEYNNFNGVIAISSAMHSSSVHRLYERIKDRLPSHLTKALDEASALIQDHLKLYWEKLRSINPPCVPFFGQYQTHIVFLREGNPDCLPNTDLINFSKWRKVAEIISEIQQYQNQPYCLKPLPSLKNFLETLSPFPDMTENERTEYLWKKSVELEPKGTETLRKKSSSTNAAPKWKNLNLKSPGIKPRSLPGKNHPNPLPRIRQSNRNQTDNNSPLTSPVFQFSPSSLPSTPFATPSPAKPDPVKTMVMLPMQQQTPPQLPPKPPRTLSGSSFSSMSSSLSMSRPPLVSRQSSPPPPLPPRRDQPLPRHHSSRSSFEFRSPTVSDPHHRNSLTHSPPPPPLPRHQHSDCHHQFQRPSPLNLRTASHHEGPSPSPSPLWSATSSGFSPSTWSSRNGPPPYSTPTGPSPARPDFNLSMTSSRGNSEQHFNFSQQSIVSSGIGTDQATLSPTSPRLPPRKPVAGIDPFQGPRDNYERVNEWLQSPPPSTTLPTELLMP